VPKCSATTISRRLAAIVGSSARRHTTIPRAGGRGRGRRRDAMRMNKRKLGFCTRERLNTDIRPSSSGLKVRAVQPQPLRSVFRTAAKGGAIFTGGSFRD
jgi:hypothetical protein